MRGFQRRFLRSQAHHLNPVVLIGKNGVTASLIAKVDEELDAHELIKIRFVDFKSQRRELTAQIAEASRSEIGGVLGNTAILYREQADPERRRIRLPTRDPRNESDSEVEG